MEVITTHINADFDSLASMMAAKKLYPQAILVFPGSQEKNLRDFFVQSTFYLFQAERIKNVDFGAVTRLILVDTRQPGRIGKFREIAGRPGLELHIYDHHPPSPDDLKGTVEHIREVGATVTILAGILRERNMALTAEEATVLALGLYEDTGAFTFSSTTVEDFEAGAFLLARGANLNIVSSLITRELTPEQISLLNELIQSAVRYTVKGVEVVVAKASAPHYVGDFAVLVHKLKDMENINVLFALAQMEDRVYLVARSRVEEVNVGEIAASFGGGGHATAASATLRELSPAQVEEKLLSLLEGKINPVKRAKDLMSYPVKTVDGRETIERTGGILTRYNINVLPVTERERVVGLISRQVVEKAAFHGFANSPVRDYMTSEFASVHPQTPLSKVQDLIVGHNQRFLPVMEKERLAGAITRTDLLRWLYASSGRGPQAPAEQDFSALRPRKREMQQLMAERLPAEVLRLLRAAGRKAQELGFEVYAVGGFVRDLMLRTENFDIDLVVEGDGILLAQAMAAEGQGEIRVHRKFGTATLRLPHPYRLDIATARLEFYDHPAALPRVEHSSIKLDLYRRDFTVNALAIHLNPRHFGEQIDFFGGQRDLKERMIRVLHNLSFVEDPTRIFRALRFEQRFHFQIAKHTQQLMENAVRLGLFGRLSGRRLFHELALCLEEERPFAVVKRMKDLDLLKFFHPRLRVDRQREALFRRLESVISWYNLLFTGETHERWLVPFLGLTDGLGEKEIGDLLERLAFPRAFIRSFAERREAVGQLIPRLAGPGELRRSELYNLLHPLPTAFLLYAMGRTESGEAKKAVSVYFTELKRVRTFLKGRDLKEMGFPPGPLYQEILQALLRERLDGRIHSAEEEAGFVRENYGGKTASGAPGGKELRFGSERGGRPRRRK